MKQTDRSDPAQPAASLPEDKRPRRKAAVALRYDTEQDAAPIVLAAGQGELATAILESARAHGVPVREDHPLAEALVKLEVGGSIPAELYAAVAEVLAFLWRMEQEEQHDLRDRS